MRKVYPIKASVLMLAYNQRPYIDEAIRSAVLQDTTFDFELIVSDDASTDGTADRCRWWQQRYPNRVRVVKGDRNVGLAANFVRTYQAARGEYIAVCEADDFWTDRHKLQIQVDFLDTHPDYSACFHRVINYYQADGSKSLSGGPARRTVTLSDLSLCNPITNVSVCYRHAVADTLPAWMDQVTSYDLVMHILCAEHGDIYYMRRVMAVYRKLETSIWTGGDKAKRAMISLKNRDLLIAYFQDRNREVCRTLQTANARNRIDMALYYEAQGMADKAQECWQQVTLYRPDWTTDDLARERRSLAVAARRPNALRRMLTVCRRGISKWIALPHVKGKA
ncbi:MAG: glycosyltransferase [Prevotella sp.]